MLSRISIIVCCFLASCAGPDRVCTTPEAPLDEIITQGSRQFLSLIEACLAFRERNGSWPAEPLDLRSLVSDSELRLDRAQQMLRFDVDPRGLAVVDRETGKRIMMIANESTRNSIIVGP